MKIRFKKLHTDAVMPKRATTGAAGFDLTAVTCKYGDNGIVFYDTGTAEGSIWRPELVAPE